MFLACLVLCISSRYCVAAERLCHLQSKIPVFIKIQRLCFKRSARFSVRTREVHFKLVLAPRDLPPIVVKIHHVFLCLEIRPVIKRQIHALFQCHIDFYRPKISKLVYDQDIIHVLRVSYVHCLREGQLCHVQLILARGDLIGYLPNLGMDLQKFCLCAQAQVKPLLCHVKDVLCIFQ